MQQVAIGGPTPAMGMPPAAAGQPSGVARASLVRRLLDWLPSGAPLSDEAWERRHRAMVILVAAHALAIPIFLVARHYEPGFFQNYKPLGLGVGHALFEGIGIALFALFGSVHRFGRRVRELCVTLGLLTASAALVHIFDGYIEFHFHYFVMVAVIALYQDWTPFLIAIAYVALQHGAFGFIDPYSVYNHHSGQQHPWQWAGVHALFILGESAALLVGWRVIEQEAARRQAALEETNRTLQESNRLKGEFLSTMSHELRAPMNSIIGYGQLLLDGVAGDMTPEQAADVAQITDSAEVLLRLIDNVLDLSKIEAGRMDIAPEALDLTRIASQVRSQFAIAAGEKNLALLVDIPSDLPAAWADPDHVRQILINLVGNAVKFTDRGRVTIAARAATDGVRIAVSDTGVGIPQSALDFIFEAFRQADSSLTRRYGGTGLGLSIARRLAELQGGRIEVESRVGVGSTFTLVLPPASGQTLPVAPAPVIVQPISAAPPAPSPLPASVPLPVAAAPLPPAAPSYQPVTPPVPAPAAPARWDLPSGGLLPGGSGAGRAPRRLPALEAWGLTESGDAAGASSGQSPVPGGERRPPFSR